MKELIDKVKEFHKVFELEKTQNYKLNPSIAGLRSILMDEENEEYYEACRDKNDIEIADALGDQLYILLGTIIAHGLEDKIVEVFNEIHRSNMSKLGPNGKPLYREDGKVLKGPNYFKPNIKKVLDGEDKTRKA